MKHFRLAALLCLAPLASCATLPTGPGTVANSSALDEQGALAAEMGYKAARTAMELAVDTGALKGRKASQAALLDQMAYDALLAVRAAYKAGNAPAYDLALIQARTAVAGILSLIGR